MAEQPMDLQTALALADEVSPDPARAHAALLCLRAEINAGIPTTQPNTAGTPGKGHAVNSTTTESTTGTPTVIPQISYASAPALEVRDLGGGERILQSELLAELKQLNEAAPAGTTWRLETPHELFALRSPLTHENANDAHSIDESIKAGWYWTSEETPWSAGGRVVVGFSFGLVYYSLAHDRAFARAVRVVGQ